VSEEYVQHGRENARRGNTQGHEDRRNYGLDKRELSQSQMTTEAARRSFETGKQTARRGRTGLGPGERFEEQGDENFIGRAPAEVRQLRGGIVAGRRGANQAMDEIEGTQKGKAFIGRRPEPGDRIRYRPTAPHAERYDTEEAVEVPGEQPRPRTGAEIVWENSNEGPFRPLFADHDDIAEDWDIEFIEEAPEEGQEEAPQ
jgi:hypothetical protein